MDHSNSTTTSRKKGRHLSFEDRVVIQTLLKEGRSYHYIAKQLNCSPTTVSNEVRRGTVSLYHNHVIRYKASVGQDSYRDHRRNCGRHFDYLKKSAFIAFVMRHFFRDGWSLDACYGYALTYGLFTREEMVCVKTLYSYVDKGLIGIRNHHLPEKLSRSRKKEHVKHHRRVLGRSIEERPASISSREEFGHWECDLVLGSKKKDDQVLLTMLERKTREFLVMPAKSKEATDVMAAFHTLQEQYGEHFGEVFRTITTDNGSEFAMLSEIEKLASTLVYYAHPYSSWEKGSVERHNRLIRRFIPKGRRIDQYSSQDIADIELWCNGLPRRLLRYRTPEELFDEELDKIYQLDA